MAIQRPSAAGSGDRIDLAVNLGRFLLIWPKAKEDDIPTSFGDREAIRADVLVLDDPAGPTKYDDVLLFGVALIGQLKGAIGCAFTDPVAGRLAKGTAKAGQNAPWVISDEFTDADVAAAEQWIAANPVSRLQRPAPPTPAVAPQQAPHYPTPTTPVAQPPASLFPPPATVPGAQPAANESVDPLAAVRAQQATAQKLLGQGLTVSQIASIGVILGADGQPIGERAIAALLALPAA